METSVDISKFIVSSPDIRGGRPRIAGTGVTVQRIVGWSKLGLAPEDISNEIGYLSLAQVYAALAYYHANKDEIEAAIEAEAQEAAALEAEYAVPKAET
jgi:uncharacterized protein (DUF433 family)